MAKTDDWMLSQEPWDKDKDYFHTIVVSVRVEIGEEDYEETEVSPGFQNGNRLARVAKQVALDQMRCVADGLGECGADDLDVHEVIY